MSEDWNSEIAAANRQLQRLGAQWAQAEAEYRQAEVSGDEDTMDLAIQQKADIEQSQRNIYAGYNARVANYYANMPRQPTQEEIQAKPITAMSHQELFDHLSKTSKHGVDLEAYKRGMDYVARNPIRR
jgi:hypothetical protein